MAVCGDAERQSLHLESGCLQRNQSLRRGNQSQLFGAERIKGNCSGKPKISAISVLSWTQCSEPIQRRRLGQVILCLIPVRCLHCLRVQGLVKMAIV